jgi:hypothetical protein
MEKNMAFEISGVDVKKGLDLCDGDLKIYVRILRSYVSDIKDVLDKIKTVSELKLHDYAVSVHGVKSTSDAVGAEDARKTAKHLEEMAKGGDFAGVMAENSAFVKYLEKLVDGIQKFLEKHGEP